MRWRKCECAREREASKRENIHMQRECMVSCCYDSGVQGVHPCAACFAGAHTRSASTPKQGSQYNREASDREKEKDIPTLKVCMHDNMHVRLSSDGLMAVRP